MAHESFDREQQIALSSDRSFGFVMAGAFFLVSLWPLLHGGEMRQWSAYVALCLVLVAIIKPAVLRGANRLWAGLGLYMGRLTSPLFLAIVFFLVLAPIAVLARALGKDSLRTAFDHEAPTYWIERTPPGPQAGSMSDAF